MSVSVDLSERIRHSVTAHSQSMLRLAYTYVHSTHDAQDVVQEVFLSFFRLAPTFSSAEHEKAWLLRATVNRSKNLVKSGWFKSRGQLSDAALYTMDEGGEVLDAVMSLAEPYRLPIHLYYYEGYQIKEIAEILGEKSATIGTRLARGRDLLKAKIGGIEHV